MNTRNDLHGLTIFRFVSAFYVFLFHCNIRYRAEVSDWLKVIVANGQIGMSFFFVLSGFVMAWSSRDGIKENYFRARFARIFPAYLLMGVITLPFIYDYDIKNIITYLLLFITAMQSWIPSTFNQWNFSGSWSVSTEAFFYLVFPLLLPIIKKKPKLALLISIIISSAIIPISMLIIKSPEFPSYYISPIHRLPEFVSGVAIGCIFSQGVQLKHLKVPLLILAVCALLFISPYDNNGGMRNNYVTLPATCIVIYCLACSTITKNLITTPLIYLGKISYSFYLMQLPIMFYITKHHDVLAPLPTWLIWLVLAMINLLMAAACYHLVEDNKAIKSFILNWNRKPPRVPKLD